ncbi:MAG: aldehyde dehydrogenase family protein [Trueperaceae bacterium]
MIESAPAAPRLPKPGLLIGGEHRGGARGETRSTVNPATGEAILELPEATGEDVQKAVSAARRAFDTGPWPRLGARERSRLLNGVADLIERDQEELAWLETLDTGKTLVESRDDMAQIAWVFRYYAALILSQTGSVNAVPADALSLTLHEPLGVVAMVTPWNYPLLQASWKIAPALAAGCTFVIKPSELTPLTTLRLGELLGEAGTPPGVVNVVLGAGETVGKALVESPQIDMISFTGGIATGRTIGQAAAAGAKRVALELGGKNPNIVFADADFDAAADHALNAVFFHAGQICSAGSRLLVESSLHDRLVEAVLERARDIRLGFGWEEATEMGPLISAEHRDKVESYVRLAQEEGASLKLGGDRAGDPRLANGFFLEPTVLTGLPSSGRVAHEEIFGPVLTVERFADADEALAKANDTPTGLAAAVWTRDTPKGVHLAQKLRFGTVWLNDFHPYYPEASWGGYKESGVGRELGPTGLREYQEEKHLYLNLDVKPAGWFGRGGSR